MPGRQKTFDLIPTTLAVNNGPRRAMTSKAAQKAYKKSTDGPRISRAEQRRRDAEESAAQKREHEKERNATKAKAAREKRVAKEKAEKEARKRNGIPEPSKFVRASQPTISRFVKGAGGKRSWQEMESVAEDSECTIYDSGMEEQQQAQHPAKRPALAQDSDDEFGDFPSLSQSDILEKIDSSMVIMGPDVEAEVAKTVEEEIPCASPQLPPRKSSDDEHPLEDEEELAQLVTTQLLSEAAEADAKDNTVGQSAPTTVPIYRDKEVLPLHHAPKSPDGTVERPRRPRQSDGPSPVVSDLENVNGAAMHRISDIGGRRLKPPPARPVLQQRSANMRPPCLPAKINNCISSLPPPIRPPAKTRSIVQVKSDIPINLPPSSTQAFLETHIDDFFPSPTQEIRELDEDQYMISSDNQIAKDLCLEKPTYDDEFDGLICTQDLILSSQDLAEIGTPSYQPTEAEAGPPSSPPRPAQRKKHQKPPFFEVKDGDREEAAQGQSQALTAKPEKETPGLRHSVSNSTDYGDMSNIPDDFEDTIPEDIIRESQLLAAQNKAGVQVKGPYFQEKEDDKMRAALHESIISARGNASQKLPQHGTPQQKKKNVLKMTNSEKKFPSFDTNQKLQKVPLKEAQEKTVRSLTRAQSNATDYGLDSDDDLFESFMEDSSLFL